mgnify:FL=1
MIISCKKCAATIHIDKDVDALRRRQRPRMCALCNSTARRNSSAKWRSKNLDRLRAAYRKRYHADPQKFREKNKDYHERNRDRMNEKSRSYRIANLEKMRVLGREWHAQNTERDLAANARRRAAHAKATPMWANRFFIEEAYRLAELRTRVLGYPWHVDHIVPLRSPLVCGLHVENNLRVIPGIENSRKGNRHWPNMSIEIG